MDLEKAIADQNYVLGEIKSKVENLVSLQTLANGRTGKLEAKVDLLENAKSKLEGQMSTIRWIGGIFVAGAGLAELLISHYWK